MKEGFAIAIDGPAAAGKGTIVQMLTDFFHGVNIYTGGMYRALGLKCLQNKVSFDDKEAVIALLHNTQIDLGDEEDLGVVASVYLDGEDVTEAIKAPEAGIAEGKVVLIREVREEMLQRQRLLVDRLKEKGKIVILDGQDTALLYPEAKVKIFLTASQQARAKRRQRQYDKRGLEKSYEAVFEEIKERDARDWSRELHPLSADPEKDGYFLLDSTNLDEEETTDKKLTEIAETVANLEAEEQEQD